MEEKIMREREIAKRLIPLATEMSRLLRDLHVAGHDIATITASADGYCHIYPGGNVRTTAVKCPGEPFFRIGTFGEEYEEIKDAGTD